MEGQQEYSIKRTGNGVRTALFIILAVLLLGTVLYSRGNSIVVVEGETEARYYTFSRTVGDFISEAGIMAEPHDRLVPDLETKLQDGTVIMIKRALPVTLVVDHTEQECWTHARDVSAFLRERGIMLGMGDHVKPGFAYALQPDDRVEVTRASVEYFRQREPIPFETVRMTNANLDRGIVKVKQEGMEGEKELVIAVIEQEGGAVSHNLLAEHVVREPVPRVLEYGENSVLARGGRTFEFTRTLEVEATAYCPGTPGSGCPLDARGHALCTGSFNDGYTFTGTRAAAGDGSLENPHIIAVDPAVIPLYALVYLDGYGFAHALDRGGAIKGLTIDLLFDHHADALKFGRRQVKVYLLHD